MHGHYSARYEQALSFAYRLHAAQRRKGSGIPYVSHLLSVSALVMEHGGTLEESIAALLHDAVEDQGGDSARGEIQALFGPTVLEIVNGCTDADATPKPPWRPRKEAYLRHLREAPESVRLVSAADKLHNARTLLADFRIVGHALWSRFSVGREETLWYYRALIETQRAAAAADDRTPPLVDELERVVGELERLSSGRQP